MVWDDVFIEDQHTPTTGVPPMKLNPIRRICMLAALSVVALTGAVVSADPLPVPNAPGAAVKGPMPAVPVTTLANPADGGTLTQMDHLSWQNIHADVYVVKMTVMETGQRITKKVAPVACNVVYCIYMPNKTDFYPLVKDGQTMTWKVTAKFVDGGDVYRSTSNARTFVVDEINAPVLYSPASGEVIVTGLTWEVDTQTVQYQVLFVKNMQTGEVVKYTRDTNGGCSFPCSIYPENLEQGTKYKWWVKAKGFTGENRTSEKRVFFTPPSKS
jgi:hypothetical protein